MPAGAWARVQPEPTIEYRLRAGQKLVVQGDPGSAGRQGRQTDDTVVPGLAFSRVHALVHC